MIYDVIKNILNGRRLNIEKCKDVIREHSKIYDTEILNKIESLINILNERDLYRFMEELDYLNTIYLGNLINEKDNVIIQQDVLMTIELYIR